MARVFVSHAGADADVPGQVRRWLSSDGHEVFLDVAVVDGLVVGDEWQQRLHERLRWADAVVCVVTADYVASIWCALEVGVAQSRGTPVLPVRAEAGVTHPLLSATQYVDVTADPDLARAHLREALQRVDAAGGSGWPDGRSPFPGLRAFGTDQQRVFFGRSEEINEMAGLLRSPAGRAEASVLLVVGPSGCGKSSLVRAGLIPVMAREPGWWTVAPIVPGSDPVAELSRELTAAARSLGLPWTVAEVRCRLDDGGNDGAARGLRELAEELLLAAPSPRRTRLLIVIDQFEELLTQTPAAQRTRLVTMLGPALGGPVQVVATLRPEFLHRLLVTPELAGLATHTVTLRPLRRDALPTVIEQPARTAGIDVDPDLVARLVTDTDGGEALPLLAYTLARLADGVGRGGRLEATRYDLLGGVRGALARQADLALDDAVAAGGRSRTEVIESLLRLVTVDEHGRPTRWRVARDELPGIVVTELEPFVTRRLLVTAAGDDDGGGDDDDASTPTVLMQVAHEAFLSAWTPLARVIEQNSVALRARRAIDHAATAWVDHHRDPGRLWERGQLAAALADVGARLRTVRRTALAGRRWPFVDRSVVTGRVALSTHAREFLRASIRRDRRRRGRATTILVTLLVLALAAAGVALTQQSTAQDQQRLATARQLVAQADTARGTDQRTALLLNETAQHLHPDPEIRSGLVQTLLANRYESTLDGPGDTVSSVAFARDDRTLATAVLDGSVVLWDAADPAHPRRGPTLPGNGGAVRAAAFSPDGRTLATADADHTTTLWDLTDPARPRRGPALIGHGDEVIAVAFSPDGHGLVTGSKDDTAIVWDLTDLGHPRRGPTLAGHTGALVGGPGWVTSVSFSPDGHTVATAGNDNTVVLWRLTGSGRPSRLATLAGRLSAADDGAVSSVAFSPDGRTLATGNNDGTIVLWNVTDPTRPGKGFTLTGHSGAVLSVAFAPDGRTLATGSVDHTAIVWDVTDPAQPRRTQTFAAHTSTVFSVAFAPDGRTLATGSADHTAILWDLADATGPHRLGPSLTGDTAGVETTAFSPDGRILATGSDDHTTILWDVTGAAPRKVATLSGPDGVWSLAFSPDGRTLATGNSFNHTATLWDLTDPTRPRRGLTLTGHTDIVDAVAFSPDGRALAVGSADGTVTLWDVTDPAAPREDRTLNGHNGKVYTLAFSPDGRTLATAGNDRTATLWDLTGPEPRKGAVLSGHTDNIGTVAFSPDGRTLATGGADGTAILWDLTDLARPRRIQTLTGHTNSVQWAAFSPDGRTLATASADSTTRLWDLTDPGRPLTLGPPLTGHVGPVYSATFSPDDRTLVTGSLDGTAERWDLTGLTAVRDRPVQRACDITRGGMSPAEWAGLVPGLDYEDSCSS